MRSFFLLTNLKISIVHNQRSLIVSQTYLMRLESNLVDIIHNKLISTAICVLVSIFNSSNYKLIANVISNMRPFFV